VYEDKELSIKELAACFAPCLGVKQINRILYLGSITTRKQGRTRYANIGDIERYLDQYGYGRFYPKVKYGKGESKVGVWCALPKIEDDSNAKA
jgi:hypothetical protein